MKALLYTFLFLLAVQLFTATPLTGQSYFLTAQVIGSAGHDTTFQGKNYAFTVGEAIITTTGGTGLPILTQGFHQPEFALPTGTNVRPSQPEATVSLFPNPTTGALFLQFSIAPTAAYTVQIFNLLGQPTMPAFSSSSAESQPIDCSALLPGYYFLRVEMLGERQFTTLPFVKSE